MIIISVEIHQKIRIEIYLHIYPLKTSLMRKNSYCLFDFFWLWGQFGK